MQVLDNVWMEDQDNRVVLVVRQLPMRSDREVQNTETTYAERYGQIQISSRGRNENSYKNERKAQQNNDRVL